MNWTEVGQQFSKARYESVPVYILFLSLFFALKSIRWAWLLKPVKSLAPSNVVGPLMVGFMGNNILPAHLGEIFRVFLLSRQEKIAAGAVLSSVAIERVLDVIAVLLLVGIGMLAVQNLPTSISTGFFYIGLVALAMVVVLALAVIFIQPAVSLACWMIHRLPVNSTWKGHLEQLIRAAAEGASVLRDGKLLAMLLTNSVLQWSINCRFALEFWDSGAIFRDIDFARCAGFCSHNSLLPRLFWSDSGCFRRNPENLRSPCFNGFCRFDLLPSHSVRSRDCSRLLVPWEIWFLTLPFTGWG